MSLWVDKYRPHGLDKLDHQKHLTLQLKKLVCTFRPLHVVVEQKLSCAFQAGSDDFPHLLVYGPSGAGKKTRIMAVLRELFGPSVEKACATLYCRPWY